MSVCWKGTSEKILMVCSWTFSKENKLWRWGKKRTKFITSWNVHQLRHVVHFVAMYGSMGLFDEQVVESFHQCIKRQLVILASVPKERLLQTLFTRLHNISRSKKKILIQRFFCPQSFEVATKFYLKWWFGRRRFAAATERNTENNRKSSSALSNKNLAPHFEWESKIVSVAIKSFISLNMDFGTFWRQFFLRQSTFINFERKDEGVFWSHLTWKRS